MGEEQIIICLTASAFPLSSKIVSQQINYFRGFFNSFLQLTQYLDGANRPFQPAG